ncbi:hypothetical protein DFH09DRAFT_1094720 [Mycena vulgaris]|nr:hypothetical protein DFH09DRAFT_1094720 [Mycena vulgaris]
MLPALAPVKTVAEINNPAARANTRPRNNNARGEAEPEASDSLPVPEQVADDSYASASTPPLQGNLFCGARLLKSDSYPVIYSSIREIGFINLNGSPLIHRDVAGLDRQDDHAAAARKLEIHEEGLYKGGQMG